MATVNTPSTLASRLKVVYNKGITSLVPASTELIKRLSFNSDLMIGSKAEFDVQL